MELSHNCASVGSSEVPLKVGGSPRLKSRRHLASLVEAESFAGWPPDRFRTTIRNTSTNSAAESRAGWGVAGHGHVIVTSGPSTVSSRLGPRLLTLLTLTGVRLPELPPRVLGGISKPSNSREVTNYSFHLITRAQVAYPCNGISRIHTQAYICHIMEHINIRTRERTMILPYNIYIYT